MNLELWEQQLFTNNGSPHSGLDGINDGRSFTTLNVDSPARPWIPPGSGEVHSGGFVQTDTGETWRFRFALLPEVIPTTVSMRLLNLHVPGGYPGYSDSKYANSAIALDQFPANTNDDNGTHHTRPFYQWSIQGGGEYSTDLDGSGDPYNWFIDTVKHHFAFEIVDPTQILYFDQIARFASDNSGFFTAMVNAQPWFDLQGAPTYYPPYSGSSRAWSQAAAYDYSRTLGQQGFQELVIAYEAAGSTANQSPARIRRTITQWGRSLSEMLADHPTVTVGDHSIPVTTGTASVSSDTGITISDAGFGSGSGTVITPSTPVLIGKSAQGGSTFLDDVADLEVQGPYTAGKDGPLTTGYIRCGGGSADGHLRMVVYHGTSTTVTTEVDTSAEITVPAGAPVSDRPLNFTGGDELANGTIYYLGFFSDGNIVFAGDTDGTIKNFYNLATAYASTGPAPSTFPTPTTSDHAYTIYVADTPATVPTLGKTTIGASVNPNDAGFKFLNVITVPTGKVYRVTDVKAYIGSKPSAVGTEAYKLVFWRISAGVPAARLDVGSEYVVNGGDAMAWQRWLPTSLPDLTPGDWGVGFITSGANVGQIAYDTLSNAETYAADTNYMIGGLDPFGTPSLANNDYSIYAEVLDVTTQPPVNLTRPTISGTPQPGMTLRASDGTWSDATEVQILNWQTDASGSFGAIQDTEGDQTYKPLSGDLGHSIRIAEVGLNSDGTDVAYSDPVLIQPAPAGPPTGTGSGGGGPPPTDVATGDFGSSFGDEIYDALAPLQVGA